MRPRTRHKIRMTVLGWVVALLFVFPIIWMTLAAFKTEIAAVATPPELFFSPTLENFAEVRSRADYPVFAANSVIIAGFATLIAILLALPASYAMAFHPSKRTKDLLLWMLSTKMMPAVGVLIPIYLIYKNLHLLDTVYGLIIIYILMNLPIVAWMIYSFFKDVPKEILEAGRMDGATPLQQITMLLVPLALPGIASTALLSIILCWNEAFWSINLTSTQARPLTAFIASFSSPEGLFWAKLSAASLLAIAPILIFGFMTQRQLVRGLTFGAVK